MACEEIVQKDPRWQEAMRSAGSRTSARDDRPVGVELDGRQDDPSKRRICRPLTWVRSAPGSTGTPGRSRASSRGRPRHDARSSTSPTTASSRSAPRATTRSRGSSRRATSRPSSGTATTSGRSRSRSPRARASRSTGTPCAGRSGSPDRLHPARRARPAPDRATTRPADHATARRSSRCTSPTATPRPPTGSRTSFDQGEYGIGLLANPLDARMRLPRAHPVLRRRRQRQDGKPVTIQNAICMHEEDTGIAWKHTDFRTGEDQVRRRGGSSISTIVTVGQLRVRLLLVPVQRRHHRVRGQAQRRHLHRGHPRWRDAQARHARRPRPLRPPSPALLLRAAGDGGRRAPPTRSSRSTRCPARPARTTPTATRGRTQRTVLGTESAARRDVDAGRRASGRSKARRRPPRWASRRPTR